MESQPADSLSMIADAQSALADRLVTPWWYHPALGLLIAGDVFVVGYGNTWLTLAYVVFFVAACAALAGAYRRLTGVWIWGYAAGRASRWAYGMAALVGVAAVAAVVAGRATDLWWPGVVAAVFSFVVVVVGGRRFDRAVRAQLRAGV